jgi:superfamily II DNA helicase RecQ
MLPHTSESHTEVLDAKFREAERLVALDPPSRAVYRRLVVLRSRLAAEVGVKPYHVYTNRQLVELCEKKPLDLAGLSDISGFGHKRLVDYGDLILATIKATSH